MYAAAWPLVKIVAKDGRVAPETPEPILPNSAKKTWSVFGVLADHWDQMALFIWKVDINQLDLSIFCTCIDTEIIVDIPVR